MMSSNHNYLSSKSRLFEHLQQLEDIRYFPETSRDTVEFVKQEFKFLDFFLSLQSFTDEPDMLDVTQKVRDLFQDTVVHFSELRLAEYFDFCIFMVQNKIWLIKMEIRSKYSFPKISSLPNLANIAIPKFAKEFMDIVVGNLRDLVNLGYRHSLLDVPETKKHVDRVVRELKSLQNFVCFVSERFIVPDQSQHHVNFFAHALSVASHASMLVWLYLSGHGSEDQDVALGEINVLLFLQMKFSPIQPSIREIYISVLRVLKSTIQSGGWCPNIQHEHATDVEANFLETVIHNLVELPTNSNVSQRVALKDHLPILQEMLNLLRANTICVPIQDLELLRQDIDTVIDVGLFVFSLYHGEDEKEVMAPGEVNPTQALDLSGNLKRIISTMIRLTIRKAFQSNLPRIHGLGYVDFFLNNLKELQRRHSDSLDYVRNQLQIIQKEFESLQPFLESVTEEGHNDLDKIHRCATQLIGKAYEVEYIVDAFISKEAHVLCLKHCLLDIMEEITLLRDEVADIHEKEMVGDVKNSTVTAHASSSLTQSLRMDEEIVGFKDVTKKLKDQLINGTKGRDVITIVGMPGLGKTTLAYSLYSDRLVASYFKICAQYCVSQVYSRRDLLLAVLRDVMGENPQHEFKRADELADELRKALFSKRYLILIDDVWETSVWDDLVGCFHDANNGSRVILTTRNHEVANYARFHSDPLLLRMFTDDESLELLRKKVFREKSFPSRLTNIREKIAIRCGGLPLSVSLVAGILLDMEKKEECREQCWEQVANNIGPYIHNDSRAILEHSFRVLPYHMRSCFLYFGAFLEDSVIPISKLTRLWISEGFVKSCNGKSLEDIAEGYLENLIGRNLVMGTKRSSRGKIKACRIHDLLHDFCKERAKEQNLLLWINRDQKNVNPSSLAYHQKKLAHRLSIYGERYCIGEPSLSWSHVGSIVLHKDVDAEISLDPISLNFHSFKFLKVLDLEFTRIDSFPSGLVYLRYFAAKTKESSMSSFVANHQHLETLIVFNYGNEMSLPVTMWEMVKLRYLLISYCSTTTLIENTRELFDNSKQLYDLKTFSNPKFSGVQEADLILRKTPNLQKLRCIFHGVENFKYHVLHFPSQLETLKIRHKSAFHVKAIPFCISAPNLKSLTLEFFFLHHKRLSEIASLQNLEVLKLNRVDFEDMEWEVKDGEFPRLKVLKLEGIFCFKEWIVADDAFPELERLILRDCEYLQDIPSSFAELSSLKWIEVKGCNKSVENSTRDIWVTKVEDYQISDFDVFVHKTAEKKSRSRATGTGTIPWQIEARAIISSTKVCRPEKFPLLCSTTLSFVSNISMLHENLVQ
ncbi:Late blight resistance protein R1-A [Capsicum chinense]|nr:Late blight resistance protein R1-A [Capsicum chinense]